MASFSQSGAGSEPTFSYAEAAKGRRPAPKPPIGDQATESTASQSPSLNGTSETSITHQDSTPESRLDTAISKLENKDTAVKPILSVTTPALPEDISSKHKSETESPSSKHLSPQTAFSAAESPTDRLLEHQPNGGPETNGIESLNLGGDPVGHVNNDGNELVASWDAASTESQGKPPAAPAAAPLPVVNVWQKRREALYPKSTTNLPTKKGRLEDNTSHGKETLHDPMPDSGMSQTAGGFQKASGPSAKGEAGLLDTEFSTAIPAEQSSPTKKQHTNKPINGISNGIAGTATSWPTPDHATEESRRKMADRTDRSEKNDKEDEKDRQNPNKSKRKGWVALPFVPTVNFNTPLPSPRRIGKYNSRVNRDDTAAENGGKEQQGQEEYQLSAEDHGQGADGFARSSGQYKGRARFENNAKGMQQNQAIAKRTNILVSNPGGDGDNVRSSDRPLEAPHRVADQSSYQPRPSQTGYVPRRASSATQTDHDWRERNDSRLPLKTTNFADTSSGTQQSDLAVTQQRPPGSYRSRGPESVNSHDFAQFRREGTSEQNVFNHPQRDHRGDKIADRGRGNDRRRGGGDRIGRHPPLSANTMMNGTAPVDSSSYVTTTSPTKQPGGFASFSHPPRSSHPPANHRTNRGGAKTHSLPYPQITHPLSASPRVNSFYNASPRELDYQPHYEVPMYHPAQESLIYENQYPDVRLFSFLRDQMDYYFGLDNLLKDMYLRKHMNVYGCVPLSFIAKFNRIQNATVDLQAIQMAARASPAIEVIVASDSTIWLRPRGNWQQWVLPADQRESFARVEDSRRGENGKEISPVKAKSQSPDLGAPQAGGIPASFGSDEAQSFQNVDQGPGNLSNGEPSGPRPVAFSVDTNTRPPRSSESAQLSATVPEFSPMSFQSPQHAVHPDIEPEAFESSEVPNLYIITRSTLQPVTSPKAMSTSAGDVASTDGSEKAQGPDKSANTTVPDSDQPVLAPLESEDNKPLSETPSKPPFTPPTQLTVTHQAGSQVRWVKNAPSEVSPLPDGAIAVMYKDFRVAALGCRNNKSGKAVKTTMLVLYAFWAHFLVDNFNRDMYHEFRDLAIQDLDDCLAEGATKLAAFYDAIIQSPRPMSQEMAHAYNDLGNRDLEKEQQHILGGLRASWQHPVPYFPNQLFLLSALDDRLKNQLLKER